MGDFFLGADVSKGYADFVLMDASKQVVEQPFRLDDTPTGHAALRQFLKQFCARHGGCHIHAAVESTGGYENNWLQMLQMLAPVLPVKSARINPRAIANYLRSGMARTLTDESSAEGIAAYMTAFPEKVLFDQDDAFYPMRRQWNALSLLKRQCTQLHNSLHSFLYIANPAVLIYCRHGFPGWLLSVLQRYPTAADLAKARPSTLAAIPYVGEARAQSMVSHAKTDVASSVDAVTHATICQIIVQIRALQKGIDTIQSQLCKQWHSHPTVELLSTVPGIGVVSAIGLLMNIRDIKLYPSAKELASYFGMHPVWKESGDGASGFHLSKQGRVQPRTILYMVACSAVVHNPVIRELYRQCVYTKKMKRMKAIGVCMHKILRIVYGMLKNNTAFDPEVDKRNRARTPVQTSQSSRVAHERKTRRFQDADSLAPISRRQAKKRKEGCGSQNTQGAIYGITTPLLLVTENTVQTKER
jgi:transposase